MACESRPFFDGTNHFFFRFFILVYIENDEKYQNRDIIENLMVIRLFSKKTVPLYRNQ